MGASRTCGTFTQRLSVDGLDHGSLGGDPLAVKERRPHKAQSPDPLEEGRGGVRTKRPV
jgi:hypothetical protein